MWHGVQLGSDVLCGMESIMWHGVEVVGMAQNNVVSS